MTPDHPCSRRGITNGTVMALTLVLGGALVGVLAQIYRTSHPPIRVPPATSQAAGSTRVDESHR